MNSDIDGVVVVSTVLREAEARVSVSGRVPSCSKKRDIRPIQGRGLTKVKCFSRSSDMVKDYG